MALAGAGMLLATAEAGVRVYIEVSNNLAWVKYECTAGEVVRSFALDVSVDRGTITGISNYFVGPNSATARGYGIFPAAFRDHITVSSGTSANWSVSGYNPVASVADAPADTLPGLGTSGVTLELGALWDPALPAAAPAASGTLCALELSPETLAQGSSVRIAANASRGGVVASPDGNVVATTFVGTYVGPPRISIEMINGMAKVLFEGGELETALDLAGVWTATGNTSGTHSETPGPDKAKFFRVHRQQTP